MLLFKKHLAELVRQGQKRQTIRLWKTRRLRAGQITFAPGLGRLRITRIDRVASLASLTARDAKADGFASRAELLAEIRAIYGKRPKGRMIFRIRFAWPVEEVSAGGGSSRRDQVIDSGKHSDPPSQKSRFPRQRLTSSIKRELLRDLILARAPRCGVAKLGAPRP